MGFLIPSDFEVQTRADVRALLSVDDPNALQKAEKTAISMMRSYLDNRYDMDQVFIDVTLFDNAKTYSLDKLVYFKETEEENSEYKVYKCIAATTGNAPTDASFFEQVDPRNHFIIMLTIDILIYHKYSGRSLRTIPQLRIDRYDDAIEWLLEAASGKNINGLPPKATAERKSEFRWGGNTIEDHRY